MRDQMAELELNITAEWTSKPKIRAEFGELARYAAFRRAAAHGGQKGYDADGEKVARPTSDAIERAIVQSEEEDRLADVDPRLPVETRAEQVWKAIAAIRGEFGTFETYLGWRRKTERDRQRRS